MVDDAAFRVQGMAFVVAGALAVSAVRPRRGGMAFPVFACVYGSGSVLVGLFPSGSSDAWQLLDAGGATAAIVGGNLDVPTAGWAGVPDNSRVSRLTGYGLGAIGLLSGALLVATDLPTGACERGAIYSIIAWQLVAGVAALASARGPSPLGVVSTDRADGRRADGRAR